MAGRVSRCAGVRARGKEGGTLRGETGGEEVSEETCFLTRGVVIDKGGLVKDSGVSTPI